MSPSDTQRDQSAQNQTFRDASNFDELETPPNKTKDRYSTEEIADVLNASLDSAYETRETGEVIVIDNLTIEGARQDHDGLWRCRTGTSWPLIRRAKITIKRSPMQPVGSGIIETDPEDTTEETMGVAEWDTFLEEHTLSELDRHDKHDNVFELPNNSV